MYILERALPRHRGRVRLHRACRREQSTAIDREDDAVDLVEVCDPIPCRQAADTTGARMETMAEADRSSRHGGRGPWPVHARADRVGPAATPPLAGDALDTDPLLADSSRGRAEHVGEMT